MSLQRRPFGPAAAALLATGIACATFGLLTIIAQASPEIADALTFMPKVGPLSGEAIVSSVAFFALWKGLAQLWGQRDLAEKPILLWTGILVAIGFILTFPPVFQRF